MRMSMHSNHSQDHTCVKWMKIGETNTNGEVIILKGSTKNRCNKKLHTNDCIVGNEYLRYWNGFQSTIESV